LAIFYAVYNLSPVSINTLISMLFYLTITSAYEIFYRLRDLILQSIQYSSRTNQV